jgi:2-keto-4-pentenoate hydratase
MNAEQTREAARLLLANWRAQTRIAALPAQLRPANRAEAYAVQAAILKQSGQSAFGWKIAATSAAGQAHIGVDGPLAGRLISSQVYASGARLVLGNSLMRVAEIEFAFRMARTLSPRSQPWSEAEVIDAVDALHLAIEVPDSRYDDFIHAGAAQLIADCACADRFVLGPVAPDTWRSLNLAEHEVFGHIPGRSTVAGRGANVLGDPRIALAWIANELSRHGLSLAAGEIITTGTCVVPVVVSPGDTLRADFGPLGEMSVAFS